LHLKIINKLKNMIKIISILLIVSLGYSSVSAQNPVKVTNRYGTFYVKYLGSGSWYDANNQAQKDGYKLPSIKELREILMKTPMSHPIWNSFSEQGYHFRRSGSWVWTSMCNDRSWSDYANQNMALAMRFGSENKSIYEQEVHDGEEFLAEKKSSYGNIFAIKKIK
jgi:hypothetical protein